MLTTKHCQSAANSEHHLVIVKKHWQTMEHDPAIKTIRNILEHSREMLVCDKCGEMLDPFKENPDGQ